ncbi:MAG: BatD family protein [Desulfobacterales bacterium]|jgi:hypothetical protein|nr:BatD family protein [Desulfobacterales bacterium]
MKQLVGLFCLLFFFPQSLFAETVQAFVDRTTTSMDTPIQLTVSIPSRDATVDTSVIKDFEVQPAGTSTQVQIINGTTHQEETYRFLLIPNRSGRLTVPSLRVHFDGQTHHTQPIEVQVAKGDNRARDTGGPGIEVKAEVSEAAPFIGQQVIYSFVLRFGIQIANTKYTAPDFSGFTAKQIGEQQSRQRVISGHRYQEVMLSYLLIPMKTGPLTIAPAVLRCDTVSQQHRRSDSAGRFFNDPFFSDSFFGNRQLTPRILRTEPLTIQVRALPAETGQAMFSGLVGHFTMSASIEPMQIKVGDSATLVVTVAGTGNIMDANAPVIEVPDAFKQYADTPESDIKLGSEGYQGKKVFRLALVGVTPGAYQVSLGQSTYFDPKESAYRSLAVSPLSIAVQQADGPRENPVVFSSSENRAALPGIVKKKVDFVGRDILPIKTGIDAVAHREEMTFAGFLTAIVLPALFFLLGMGGMKWFKKNGNPATVMTQKSIRALKVATKSVGDSNAAFLSNLYRSLVYGVCAKAESCSESLTYAEAGRILQAAGISAQQSDRVSDLMKKIDSARYSGFALDRTEKDVLLSETARIVKEVLR